jgi:HPt (histidine-containing phosphotransfer) domain-containing protein
MPRIYGHLTKPVERNDLKIVIAKFAKPSPPRIEALADSIAARRPVFLANRQADLARMREAFAASDFETIQHIAHNCKGIGSGYGFPEISRIGAATELAARAFDGAQVEKALDEFERCVHAT